MSRPNQIFQQILDLHTAEVQILTLPPESTFLSFNNLNGVPTLTFVTSPREFTEYVNEDVMGYRLARVGDMQPYAERRLLGTAIFDSQDVGHGGAPEIVFLFHMSRIGV